MMLRRLIGARIFFPPLGYCLFEALHEPAPRRTWGAVGPIDGRHRGHKALGRRILEPDLNARAACQACLDHVQR